MVREPWCIPTMSRLSHEGYVFIVGESSSGELVNCNRVAGLVIQDESPMVTLDLNACLHGRAKLQLRRIITNEAWVAAFPQFCWFRCPQIAMDYDIPCTQAILDVSGEDSDNSVNYDGGNSRKKIGILKVGSKFCKLFGLSVVSKVLLSILSFATVVHFSHVFVAFIIAFIIVSSALLHDFVSFSY